MKKKKRPGHSAPSKYSEAQRLHAVQLANDVGAGVACHHLKVPISTLRSWVVTAKRGQGIGVEPRRVSSPEERERMKVRAKEIGVAAAAKELGLAEVTVKYWLKKDGNSEQGPRRRALVKHSPEEIERCVKIAKRRGTEAAAEAAGVTVQTMRSWVRKSQPEQGRKVRQYTEAERENAMSLAVQVGIPQAAQMLGIDRAVLNNWCRDRRPEAIRRRIVIHSQEVRTATIQRALEVGVATAAKEAGIHRVTLKAWIQAATPDRVKRRHQRYPEKFRGEAIKLAREKGAIYASVTLGVNESTLRHWIKKASEEERKKRKAPTRVDSATKQAVLDMVVEKGIQPAAEAFNLRHQLVSTWAKQAGVKSPRVVGLHKGNDIQFSWITRDFPHLEAWRALAADWIAQQTTSVSQSINGINSFVDGCLSKGLLNADPAVALRRGRAPLDLFSSFPQSSHGVTAFNRVVDFIDHILLLKFCAIDDYGRRTVLPEYANPLTRQTHSRFQRPTESVRSPLPYGYVDQCRRLLAEGSHFGDWVWARQALGAQVGTVGQPAPDWFEVDPKLIDASDPDCVWRQRFRNARSEGEGLIMEMWSPVRWVALLLKLILPLRTFQVRALDSGEGDTWRWEWTGDDVPGLWKLNEHPLRGGTAAHPIQQGVLRRVPDIARGGPGSGVSAGPPILYINTNKTADAKLSGSKKGFTVPWPYDQPFERNPHYWIAKLRNWQEKYNPITMRTEWSELDGRHIKVKSKAQLAGFPATCFLFRLPEAKPGERGLPITLGLIDNCWFALLSHLEKRIELRGERLPGGEPIRLVDEERQSTPYPLHSLRVTLITSLVIDGNVPFPILQKIVGHSRLLMLLYYFKPGEEHIRATLQQGLERLEAAKDAGVVHFLKSASMEELIDKAVCHDTDSLSSAIARNPSDRNAAGWMLMFHGACLVGGNVSAMEDLKGIGGCYNGGPGSGKPPNRRYGPVPGGNRNCIRCRWFVSSPNHLPALVAHLNLLLYKFDEIRHECVELDRQLEALKKERLAAEEAREIYVRTSELNRLEVRWETAMQSFNDRAEDAAACFRLIERCEGRLDDSVTGSGTDLLAVGAREDISALIEEVDSELLQLCCLCEAAEIYPDLEVSKPVFRRSQLLDAALMREGMKPVLITLDPRTQLLVGNSIIRSLASAACPTDFLKGTRQVISLMDSKRSLSEVLGIDLFSEAVSQSERPLRKTIPILAAT